MIYSEHPKRMKSGDAYVAPHSQTSRIGRDMLEKLTQKDPMPIVEKVLLSNELGVWHDLCLPSIRRPVPSQRSPGR